MLRQIKNARPTFRTSSTYFCLPSITFITEVASAGGVRAGAHQEGQSSVIIWADWWTLRPELPLMPVNDYSASSVPIVPSSNSPTTMSLYPYAPSSNSSNSDQSDDLLMVCFSSRQYGITHWFFPFVQRTIDLRNAEKHISTRQEDYYEYEAVTDDGGHSNVYDYTATTRAGFVDYTSDFTDGISSSDEGEVSEPTFQNK